MKRKTLIWLLVGVAILILPCFPMGRFIFVNLKAGFDKAEREAATRPAAPSSPAPVREADQRVADFSKLDFSQNTVDAHDRAAHFVQDLPPRRGSGRNGYRKGVVRSGTFEVTGAIESISGASWNHLPSVPHGGGPVTLELSVKAGTARAYLDGVSGRFVSGFVFVDATPGHPGRLTGYLDDESDSGTPEQNFVIEAVGGEARGISYRVYR